jgi:hypothetical protein
MGGTAISEAELSQGSGAAPELIRRLVDLRIVPSRDGERPFLLGDVYRVRLAQAFQFSGIPLEAIGSAIESGHLSLDFVDLWFTNRASLTGRTFREITSQPGQVTTSSRRSSRCNLRLATASREETVLSGTRRAAAISRLE